MGLPLAAWRPRGAKRALSRKRRLLSGVFGGFLFRRRRGRVLHFARYRLSFGRRHAAFLADRNFVVLGAVEDKVERLAFDELRGQRFQQVFALELSADAARRF